MSLEGGKKKAAKKKVSEDVFKGKKVMMERTQTQKVLNVFALSVALFLMSPEE